MPGKDAEGVPLAEGPPSRGHHRPDPDRIRRALRRVLRSGRATYASQATFRDAVERELRREDPLAAVGGLRLRRIALDTATVRLSVRYAEREVPRPLERCPVCAAPLKPVRNRTLTDGLVVLGQRCTRCAYWTHGNRRVPVRYIFSRAVGSLPPSGRP